MTFSSALAARFRKVTVAPPAFLHPPGSSDPPSGGPLHDCATTLPDADEVVVGKGDNKTAPSTLMAILSMVPRKTIRLPYLDSHAWQHRVFRLFGLLVA